jgi:flagellar basal-body rod modification protein FlgD
MDLSTILSPQQRVTMDSQIDSFNKSLGRQAKTTLDREDFLQILITQLTHQDPTSPMEDRDFVAQMAQFSTLEQMINMGDDMARVSSLVTRSQAYALLGKQVSVSSGDSVISGVVEEVRGTDFPQILVGGRFYDYQNVEAVGVGVEDDQS